MLWTINREKQVAYRPTRADTASVQALQVAFLSTRDPDFAGKSSQRKARAAGGKKLPYSYRLQPGTAPIVFLVPGLGAHRLDGSSLALAEMAYDRGFSVAIVSSAMNWEFIEAGASVPLPGYTSADVHDVHFANNNDFLASSADLDWLTEALGEKHVTVYPTGSHLGSLYKPEAQAAIMDSIADLLGPGDSGFLA